MHLLTNICCAGWRFRRR